LCFDSVVQTEALHVDEHREERGPESMEPQLGQAGLVILVLAGFVVLSRSTDLVPNQPAVQTWAAMFIAIVIQSLPFLLLGVVLAAGISVLLSERVIRKIVPTNSAFAVPVASAAGVGLVGCECASVPIASSVMRKGVGAPAAMAFLLSAPAVNPVVVVSTLVAFPGMPEMALARFLGSFLVSLFVGWLWVRVGRGVTLNDRAADMEHEHGSGFRSFVASVHHDLITTAGYLTLGAMIAAGVNTFVPKSILNSLGSHAVLGVLALAAFAFIVALCSQTDAFVAASLTAFSPTARLVFLVVGPVMDVKLATLEAGVFGRQFAMRFVPLVLAVAVGVGSLLGWALL
jgi:uncharacterized membrane protein YraQ (UPF0718 family)